MITVTERPNINYVLIEGDNLQELVNDCLKRIREKSREAYAKLLTIDLEAEGTSIIDRHAGNGIPYEVVLTSKK